MTLSLSIMDSSTNQQAAHQGRETSDNTVKQTIVDLGTIDLNDPLPKKVKGKHTEKQHRHKQAVNELSQNLHKRMASLTESEACFLRALLIDSAATDSTSEANSSFVGDEDRTNKVQQKNQKSMMHKEIDEALRVKLLRQANTTLNDEMLFSVPDKIDDHFSSGQLRSKNIPTPLRKSNHGLWLAHRDGVHPKTLISLAGVFVHHSTNGNTNDSKSIDETEPFLQHQREAQEQQQLQQYNGCPRSSAPRGFSSALRTPEFPPLSPKLHAHRRVQSSGSATSWKSGSDGGDNNDNKNFSDGEGGDDDDDDTASDEEVRPALDNGQPADDDASWDSQWDANHREYDSWEVLKDEYATDFGFNFTQPGSSSADNDDDDVPPDCFQILGTSPDDPECQPHVMTPPMLDALMSFLPDTVLGQNFWLRFSLVRDGASLDTLRRYVRASQYTILAIETPNGQVFGSFTSSPWKNTYGFYGSTPAFVWKMRHSRQTRCSSLFEQAQLESEIDVFMADGYHDRIQVCRHDGLAVGGDDHMPMTKDAATTSSGDQGEDNKHGNNTASVSGFAIALEDDLLRGTTSHCRTFHNPALCGDGSQTQVFDVAGLEVWTLTPCFDVPAAEKLEMTKFFLEEQSTRSIQSFRDSPNIGSRRDSSFRGNEVFDQEQFYRRIGRDPESESRRARWQYLNTMGGVVSDRKGVGASPRFG